LLKRVAELDALEVLPRVTQHAKRKRSAEKQAAAEIAQAVGR
jgi:hypothetical protein